MGSVQKKAGQFTFPTVNFCWQKHLECIQDAAIFWQLTGGLSVITKHALPKVSHFFPHCVYHLVTWVFYPHFSLPVSSTHKASHAAQISFSISVKIMMALGFKLRVHYKHICHQSFFWTICMKRVSELDFYDVCKEIKYFKYRAHRLMWMDFFNVRLQLNQQENFIDVHWSFLIMLLYKTIKQLLGTYVGPWTNLLLHMSLKRRHWLVRRYHLLQVTKCVHQKYLSCTETDFSIHSEKMNKVMMACKCRISNLTLMSTF